MSVRRLPPLVLALVLGLLAAFAVACGDDGDERRLLGPASAASIQEELDLIAQRVEDGDCLELEPAFIRLNREIAQIPGTVDRELRRRLRDGVRNLEQIAPDECRGNRPRTTDTTETLPETIPETTPETETQTTPPPTQTTPPPTQTTPPPTQTTPPDPVPDDPTGGEPAPDSFEPPGQAKKDKG